MSAIYAPERVAKSRPRLRAPELMVELPAPPPASTVPATEDGSSEFPRHMLMWSVIGVCGYFLIIAAAMMYAAVISSPSIR